MKKLINKLWWVAPLFMLVGSITIAWIIVKTPVKEAYQIVSCDDTPNDFKCWQARYEGFVMLQSPKEAFADFRKQYDANDYIRAQCHQIAHVIGRISSKKYQDLAETYSNGDDFCSSGYYHGAIEELAVELGVDGIVAKINDICEPVRNGRPYTLSHHNCTHGLGHGLMAVTNNELFDSLADCDKLNDSWERESCYGGVFMENIMNSVNTNYQSKYIKNDDPMYPCNAVDKKYKQGCYIIQTAQVLRVVNSDFAKVFELCSQVEDPFDATCYQSLGRDASGYSISNLEQTKATCLLGTTYRSQENCFIGAVKDFIWYHHDNKPGLALCASIPDTDMQASCQQTAVEYYKTF